MLPNLVLAEARDQRVGLCPSAPPPPLLFVGVHIRHPPPDDLHLLHHFHDVLVTRGFRSILLGHLTPWLNERRHFLRFGIFPLCLSSSPFVLFGKSLGKKGERRRQTQMSVELTDFVISFPVKPVTIQKNVPTHVQMRRMRIIPASNESTTF